MQENKSANVGILIYMIGLVVAGFAVIYLSYVRDWSVPGYIGGGVLLIAGFGMLAGRAQGGVRFVDVVCPACSTKSTYAESTLTEGRAAPCKSCHAWLRSGGDAAVLVPREEVAPEPLFEAPFPSHELVWKQGCCLCGAAAGREELAKGKSVQGRKIITRTITVPLCDQHVNQRAVSLGQATFLPGLEGFALTFRSHAAALAFREANPVKTEVTSTLSFHAG